LKRKECDRKLFEEAEMDSCGRSWHDGRSIVRCVSDCCCLWPALWSNVVSFFLVVFLPSMDALEGQLTHPGPPEGHAWCRPSLSPGR
jgi:hypothetical protein